MLDAHNENDTTEETGYTVKATYRKAHDGSTAIAIWFLPPKPFVGPRRMPTINYKRGQLYPKPGHAALIREWITHRSPFRILTPSVEDGLALFKMLADGLEQALAAQATEQAQAAPQDAA